MMSLALQSIILSANESAENPANYNNAVNKTLFKKLNFILTTSECTAPIRAHANKATTASRIIGI